jgi:hypothetical protein
MSSDDDSPLDSFMELIANLFSLPIMWCWGYQIFMWLKDGVWIPVTFYSFFGIYSDTGWLGLDRIFDWFLDFNIGLGLSILGIAIIYLIKSSGLSTIRETY